MLSLNAAVQQRSAHETRTNGAPLSRVGHTPQQVADLPPISILFAAFLGYNPIEHLLGPDALAGLSAHDHAVLTGHSFFPQLIAGPFRDGLHTAFAFAIVACLVAAAASLMRGGHPESEPARVSTGLSRA